MRSCCRLSCRGFHQQLLLLDLKRRGLTIDPRLAVADGALGFWKARSTRCGRRHECVHRNLIERGTASPAVLVSAIRISCNVRLALACRVFGSLFKTLRFCAPSGVALNRSVAGPVDHLLLDAVQQMGRAPDVPAGGL
jgi:hypothetical protein